MRLRAVWPEDPIFIEIGMKDVNFALALRQEGYTKYLGISSNARRIADLQAKYPQIAKQITCSQRRQLARNNNADVLILSGAHMLYLWHYRSVRHAESVAWRLNFSLLSLVSLLCCLCNLLFRRYGRPQIVTFNIPGGKTERLLVSRIVRKKLCHRKSLHFIPHDLGLLGVFRRFDECCVRYVVLRWFQSLPEIKPNEDVDLLIADESLPDALAILDALPGIEPCDVYSETGLPRSDYCGTPYYPPQVAQRILGGAVRHRDFCSVPNPWDYFHSLAYHAVFHKGERSGLPHSEPGLRTRKKPGHDYTGILKEQAARLGIEVPISLDGLEAYLRDSGWGPSPEMLARLAFVCPRHAWLQLLAQRLPPHVRDEGLTVFVLRTQTVARGFQAKALTMIEHSGFEVLATKTLSPAEIEYSSARTRGGDWEAGPYHFAAGRPAACVVAYDRNPVPLNRRQRRKFPHRTNARIFVKERIRDAILDELPPDQGFNALHSSDHCAEAWHLIEVFAPEIITDVRARLNRRSQPTEVAPPHHEDLHAKRRAA